MINPFPYILPFLQELLDAGIGKSQLKPTGSREPHHAVTFDNATSSFHIRGGSLRPRQLPPQRVSICGYYDGDPTRDRGAAPGFGCRVDTLNGLWGFCPTSVISATDCGLAGYCVDRHACTKGCGRLANNPQITTFTCSNTKEFCSTLLLLNGVDQNYEYIACGGAAITESLYATPFSAVPAKTTSTSTSTSTSTTIPLPSTSISSKTIPIVTTETSIASTRGVLTADLPSSTTLVSSSGSNTASQVATQHPTTSAPIITSVLGVNTPGNNEKPTEKALPVGLIVGGSIGGLALICLTIIGVIFIRRRQQNDKKDDQQTPLSPTSKTETPKMEFRAQLGTGFDVARYEAGSTHLERWQSTAELPGYHLMELPGYQATELPIQNTPKLI